MKKLFLVLFLIGISISNYAQIHNPVKWSTAVNKVSDTEYDLIIKAQIEENWHLYSQNVPEDGPIPTNFTFEVGEDFQLVGTPSEEDGHIIDDPVFGMKIKYFETSATFKQRIKIINKNASSIVGEVEFMVCDDSNCLPPTFVDLEFSISSTKTAGTILTDKKTVVEKKKQSNSGSKSLLSIFIIAFFSGFAALLTPCVFPMIPMTVSFFTKQSKSKAAGIKNAIIYGLSIVIIYVLLGSLVSAFFGADALNALSTNVWFNVIFFFLLIVFAVSFLGAFEIVLPSSWGTKVDAQADRGGFVGIFFMALALAIVSFSCTGPIVGTLLVQAAAGGNQVGPIVGMLGFSLALAIPFALFAAFPGWLNSLPKSGGWLNTVKVVLGFLELALAFKFLSNADLVLQLHWLEREVFLAIWIAIFGVLALYLFGKIQLPHDSPLKHISVGRLSLGLLSLTFTIYMIPGLWGAPLNLISAFPPAQHYSETPYGVGFTKLSNDLVINGTQTKIPEGAHLMAPHNILAFNDYDLGVAYAKKVNKPIMLDFTGHACVNCRKMEQHVWPNDNILEILKNDVVLISLYVDDKRALPEGEEIESKLRPGKKLRYIGQKWSELQTIKFGANAQPFYVLMNLNEENLNEPTAYTPNVDEYHAWLKEGISNFNK
ncbi:thiol:disulfide interchange protein [Lutibacter sp. HS1-25]|uniref:protein-disulfide reductase DsbD family protein n=1 Tax=Lutibacter sp. HS1-25 TaxID=2485000 RepID=UPI00101191E5|nr:cytochrome c biogenesis protein CcdA [Lutibacter sp. HS1-25]RXP64480.1 thiol:disulfide interchange protein [Lutibacter sp. HS1-25]